MTTPTAQGVLRGCLLAAALLALPATGWTQAQPSAPNTPSAEAPSPRSPGEGAAETPLADAETAAPPTAPMPEEPMGDPHGEATVEDAGPAGNGVAPRDEMPALNPAQEGAAATAGAATAEPEPAPRPGAPQGDVTVPAPTLPPVPETPPTTAPPGPAVTAVPAPIAPGPGARVEVLPIAMPGSDGFESLARLWPTFEKLRGDQWGMLPASLLVAILLLLGALLRTLRRALPREGALPQLIGAATVLLRATLACAIALWVFTLAGPLAEGAYPWLLIAAALALGWSVRDVVPDVFAAWVLRLENRIKPGVWVAGDGYEGVVDRRGLRATWLRDPHGDHVAVPNRSVLHTALRVQDAAGTIHDVAVRVENTVAADIVRKAIIEAVLTSPYVAPEARPEIRRDGTDGTLWRVRARLLHERYATPFEGTLLERVEAVLRAPPTSETSTAES